ncbi:FAD-linked oxidase C-terminal domain-containing protein [Brevibacterium sp. SMBL_HHYL_HB1]|jgi:glycolate oxidase|uniref:FAD-binding oxidoreductase n=1 Tax=Brevibacterium sp. SMBL_HHYL_HB1 TaxID=2777556 RepID=UPI001BAAF19A|nr:FAD-linked oxidase C-terminal domain-containing protein [Brevibacterium sp. SMBL_HHYL_HB1]QUL78998.1 FAD-binding protein [Brevibacterium sp. SMBL_HHYL_HB1]
MSNLPTATDSPAEAVAREDGVPVFDPAALADLGSRLSPGSLTTDPDVVDAHSSDEALFCPREGAIALVRAASTEDVQEVMRFATEHRVPVVPQGARSGISGGANAVPGAILLNVSKMKDIVAVNEAERLVTVQPGIINQDLKDRLAPYGLSYPPDPGSVALSSIGGNIATNAGGLCCVKYGVTRDYVRSLKVVLADGTLTTLGPATAKGVAGLDMRHLFIGSEGTLGIVVEATLRLIPALPDPFTAIATFPDERSGLQTVADFMAGGGVPSLLEFLDGSSLRMLNDYGDFGLDAEAGAMLIMQVDQSPTESEAAMETFAEVARRCGALDVAYSDDPTDSAALITARRMIQPAYEKFAGAHGGGQLLDDVCLPRTAVPEFCDRLSALRESSGLEIALVAHAGDGNMHPSVFFDAGDEAATATAQEVFEEIMRIGIELGGTITGEHGVGYLKRAWLPNELDEGSRRIQMAVKNALDPLGILNPGKMLAQV